MDLAYLTNMEQEVITFEKGLYPQFDPTVSMPGTYVDAVNMVRDDAGNMVNEPGTSVLFDLGAGFEVVGKFILNSVVVVASSNGVLSRIGIFDGTTYTVLIENSILGFTKTSEVQMEGRVNYKGERIIYLCGKGIKVRSINLDNIPQEQDFDKLTSLFLEYSLPKVDLRSVNSGGEVKSGVYQFAARLVTESNNATAFGPVSSIIPIGTGSLTGNRKDYQGGTPQTLTSSSITVSVTNLDTSFKYIELAVITYIGEANIVSVKSLGKVEIRNQEVLNYTYYGDRSEVGNLLEEELELDSVNYVSGNYITQKDNTLLIAGVTEQEDDYDWQSVANGIELEYIEHLREASEDINIVNQDGISYKSLDISTQRESAGWGPWTETGIGGSREDYKNPETCAKFVGYKRNEVYSFTFTPIFASGRKGNAYHIPARPKTKSTGLDMVSVPSTFYGQEFGALAGRPVSYHKMPDNTVSPFYKNVNGIDYINILGVKANLPNGEWKDKVKGYIIGRESRQGKETIITQGILKRVYRTGSESTTYSVVPSTGKCRIQDTKNANLGIIGNSINSASLHPSIFTFYSPDFIISSEGLPIPSKLRLLSNMNMVYEYATTGDNRRNSGFQMGSLISCKPSTFLSTYEDLTGQVSQIRSASVDPEDRQWIPGKEDNVIVPILGQINLYGRRFIDSVAMQCKNSIPQSSLVIHDHFFDSVTHGSSRAYYRLYSGSNNVLELYELYKDNPNLYGDVYNKTALQIKTVLFNLRNTDDRTGQELDPLSCTVFGGDTFISRYAMTLKDTVPFYGTVGDEQVVPKSSTIVYFMLESTNNYNFRHYNEADQDTPGNVPYYPKYRILENGTNGINDLPVSFGHSETYNKQYSVDNKFQNLFTKALGEETIINFPNRVIYSSTSIEGEKFDAYRLFLPANYHDIPKQYGNITGIFNQGADLFAHTEFGLWRSFYNTLATQVTSAGDIVLGNGGAFNRPSIPVVTAEGGYAGCIDIRASVGTPMGRYFFDFHNKKFYLLGEGLQEISNPVIYDLLRNTIKTKDSVLGYDKGRKRIILSGQDLTISYKPEFSSFESKHSYIFNHLFSVGLLDVIINKSKVHKFDSTKVNTFLGTIANSKIVIKSATSLGTSKRYISMEVLCNSKNPTSGIGIPEAFFDLFKAYSFERNTGNNTLRLIKDYTEDLETLGNVFVYKANNKYRLAIPPDIVYDINRNIHDVTNWVTHPSYTDDDRTFLPDMIDHHMIFEFTLTDSVPKFLKVNSFIINFNQNIT